MCSHSWCSLNLECNIFKKLQLPHHHSISLVLISHLVTKAPLEKRREISQLTTVWKRSGGVLHLADKLTAPKIKLENVLGLVS